MVAWNQQDGNNVEVPNGKFPTYSEKCGWKVGAIGFPETASPDARARTEAATLALGQTLVDAAPDVIIAFLDDHFENFFRTNMPSIAVGVAAAHSGPADQLMEALRVPTKRVYAGNPAVAEHLLRSLVADGFDAARTGAAEFGQNLLMPWVLMQLDGRLPPGVSVVPVFVNVFSPPLIRYSRAYALGQAVRRAVDALPAACRVAFMCTGGLSHWPPYWSPAQAGEDPADPFLAKMKEYQTFGPSVLKRYPRLFVELDEYEIEMARKNEYPLNSKHPLINEDWDRKFLKHYCDGDNEWLRNLTYEEVEEEAGHGGHEVLNYVAVSGAMGGKKAKLLLYEPVLEWICGMAYVDFEVGKETNGSNGV
ncbi:protocatechuate-dioxygenase subunit beta [Neofusicoccum parvum]|nr:protocatechuate-dioxygenase subunit beta [Neofusicoccum parvum]